METDPAFEKLRAKFPPEVVGKLPRITCTDCSKKNCQKHTKSRCDECGNWITSAHIHLDYVGHAEITDRLLSVDAGWSWEPMAVDEHGLPLFTKGAGGELTLWIRLTVLGVTRLGVGSVATGAFDAEKQLIGDALRNAAMRFGVALDLWAKEELESTLTATADTGEVAGGGRPGAPTASPSPASTKRRPPPGRPAGATAPNTNGEEGRSSHRRSATTDGVAPEGQGDLSAVPPPATPLVEGALNAVLKQAARKGIDVTEVADMAGKELEKVTTIEEVNAISALIATFGSSS